MKKLFYLFIFWQCACASSSQSSRAVIPAYPSLAEWPDSGAAILENESTLHLTRVGGQPVVILHERVRFKVLSQLGLQAAHVELTQDGFSKIENIEARSVSPKGKIATLSLSNVKTLYLKAATQIETKVFDIPNAEVGGLVEYSYQKIYRNLNFVPPYVFGRTYPVLRSELTVIADKNIQFDFRYGHGEDIRDIQPVKRKIEHGQEKSLFIELDLPPFYREPNMPHITHVAPWLRVTVTSADAYRMQSWNDVAAEVQRWAKNVQAPENLEGDIIERYQNVRDKLQTMDVLGLGGLPFQETNTLWQGAPTTSRDAALILQKALQTKGFKAYLALVNAPTSPQLIDSLAEFTPFERVLVAVVMTERLQEDNCNVERLKRGVLCNYALQDLVFLDPACKDCRFGELPGQISGNRAMLLKDQSWQWVTIPEDPPERNRQITHYDLTLDVDGVLSGNVNVVLDGVVAQKIRQYTRLSTEDSGRNFALTKLLGEDHPLAPNTLSLAGITLPEQSLILEAKLRNQAEKITYEQFKIRPIDVAGSVFPENLRSVRRYDAIMDAPAWSETRSTVRLPVGYAVELTEVKRIVTPFAEYAAGFNKQERDLTFSRRLVLKQHVIKAADWDDFSAFVQEIRNYENTGIFVGLKEEVQVEEPPPPEVVPQEKPKKQSAKKRF